MATLEPICHAISNDFRCRQTFWPCIELLYRVMDARQESWQAWQDVKTEHGIVLARVLSDFRFPLVNNVSSVKNYCKICAV